jgi:hypothetical protein
VIFGERKERPGGPLKLADYEARAREALATPAFDYDAGGAHE